MSNETSSADPAEARVPPMQKLRRLRALLPFLKPHRALLLAWFGALAVSSAATLSLPVALKHMIDQGFSAGGDINRWFLLMFGVAVLALEEFRQPGKRFHFVSNVDGQELAGVLAHSRCRRRPRCRCRWR